jgi:hypothetical protein
MKKAKEQRWALGKKIHQAEGEEQKWGEGLRGGG